MPSMPSPCRVVTVIVTSLVSHLVAGLPTLARETRTINPATLAAAADPAVVIQSAIDAAGEGDTVVVPAGDAPWALQTGLLVNRSGITLAGEPGARLQLADGASANAIVDLIQIVGTDERPVRGVTIRDLSLDANYWAQPGAYNPRAIDIDHATRVVIENVRITRAFVGLTFGMGVMDSEAREVTITRWFDDAFNASGDGVTAGCRGIRFINCTARDAPDENAGGDPGQRDNAWEIEDGASDISLVNCVVQNAGGSGFAVRSHGGWQGEVITGPVLFERCTATGVARNGWMVQGSTTAVRVEGITLDRCTSDGTAWFRKDIRGLKTTRCSFGGMVEMGPVDRCELVDTRFAALRVWAYPVGTPDAGTTPDRLIAGSTASRGYTTRVDARGCSVEGYYSVLGDREGVSGLPGD